MITHIDQKITTWDRIHISSEGKPLTEEQSQALLGQIQRFDDIWIAISELGFDTDVHQVMDFNEEMTVEENNGYSTVEIYNGEELIYQNGI
jgi:hypothetical protein